MVLNISGKITHQIVVNKFIIFFVTGEKMKQK